MEGVVWQPTATISVLQQRAAFLSAIRHFFAQREVMEVDTPLLSLSVATAPHLASFAFKSDNPKDPVRFLQTSPEYSMKRLLAAGSGPIYYLGKAFRKDEVGKRHNPEFTMLEWYRPSWDHFRLIKEVETLFQSLLNCPPAVMVSYQTLFEQYLNFNPYQSKVEFLQSLCVEKGWIPSEGLPNMDKDDWLDLIMTHGIEPHLGQTQPTVIIDFPPSQASLAKTRFSEVDPQQEVAARFEFYYQGLELANGYHELQCAATLKKRFADDLLRRKKSGLEALPIDQYLLQAMDAGLPECAGVAVGVDRLLMLKLKQSQIANVIPFAWANA